MAFAGWAITFSKSGKALEEAFSFTLPGAASKKVLVTDLAEGKWQVYKDGKSLKKVSVEKEQLCVMLTLESGSYEFKKL